MKEDLEAVFHADPEVFVAGNLLWYAVEGEPTIRTAPDVMVAFGRPKGRRGSYKQWEEANIAPQVVFEILSPGNRPEENGHESSSFTSSMALRSITSTTRMTADSRLAAGGKPHWSKSQRWPDSSALDSSIRFEPGEGPDNLTDLRPRWRAFSDVHGDIDRRKAAEQRGTNASRKDAERRAERGRAPKGRAVRRE